MRIYLIRHGETHSNARRIVQLPTDPLSPNGLQQAGQLAERLADCGITRLISSDLARAAMTASCVSLTTGLNPEFSTLLHERNFGDLRGTPYDELTDDPFRPDYDPPAGESWEVFFTRVAEAWELVETTATQSEPLAVVTHGLILRAIVSRHLGVDLNDSEASATARQIPNTSVTIVDGAPSDWRVETLACTEHLTPETTAAGTV